jgi:NADPH2:quinone reductase
MVRLATSIRRFEAVASCDWNPEIMKAAYYQINGPASDVLVIGNRPVRQPAGGEVLVRICASGVNPSDVKSRAARPLTGDYVIPHSDGAGVIEAVSEGVSTSRIGERVWLWNGQWKRADGTAAECITLPSDQAVLLPDNTGFDVGACAGIPLLTAIQAVEFARQCDAQTILVTGAGSSVGHYVTQLAAWSGMKVIGSASQRRAPMVTAAGGNAVVDYKTEHLAQAIIEANGGERVDTIIDMDFSTSIDLVRQAVLKPHGTLISYGSNDMNEIPVPFRELLFNSLKLNFFLVYELTAEQRAAALSLANDTLSSGKLKTLIDSTFTLEETAAAHQKVESGTALGNVVLEIAQ